MKDKYGEWSVLTPSSDKKYHSRCKCSCGVIRDINNSTLGLGKSKSCGHNSGDEKREARYKESDQKILRKRFGRLVALRNISESGLSRYLCECDCGVRVEVSSSRLLNGNTMSCGCLKKETSAKLMEKIMETGCDKLKEGQVEGTSIYTLGQKISKNNRSGVKGVSKTKNGKYRAYINLKRKQKYLGIFDTIEEAQESRLQAEKELYGPILSKYDGKIKL